MQSRAWIDGAMKGSRNRDGLAMDVAYWPRIILKVGQTYFLISAPLDHVGASVVRLLLPSGGPCAVWASDDPHTGRASPCGLVDRLDKPALSADGRAGWLAAI